MKKNGFTLIELLLAIALVIIIIGLVYQVFTRQLDSAKNRTYERQINTIKQVAKDYHLQNLNSNFVTIETLNNEGLINKDDLIDPRNGSNIEGCVKFNMNQQYKQYEYLYYDDTVNCQFDTTPPTLTLKENNGSVTITARDDVGLSEENRYEYYLSTSNTELTNGTWTTYTSGESFTLTGTGDIYIWVYPIKDIVGNVNDNKTYGEPYIIGMVTIDATPPTLTLEEEDESVTITARDDVGLSEENTYEYYLSTSNTQPTGGEWTTYTSGQSFTVTGNGNVYIWVYPIKDIVGNVNDGKTYGEPYVIGMVTIEDTPAVTCSTLTLTNLVPNENDVVTSGNGQLINLGEYGIRYQGTDPNNYVEFNNETWRIIGIVDGKVKLIRDESIGQMAWNDQDGDGEEDEDIDINNWSTATLQTYLNGEYYNSLTDKTMIDTSTWYLRGIRGTQGIDKYEMYGIERGTGSIAGVVMYDTPSIERNIGLMYPSDYGFAAQVTSTCTDTKDLINYESCQTTNWIVGLTEWLITPSSYSEDIAFLAASGGWVGYHYVYDSYGVRPVLYLKSNVKFTGDGDGSENNKCQLAINTSIDSTRPTLTLEEENGSVTITASDDVGLSDENTYQYYSSTSNTELIGGTWTTYTSGESFTVTRTRTNYIWVYPVKDTSGNVNVNKTFGEPYVIGSVYVPLDTSLTLQQAITNAVSNENDVITIGDGQLINLGEYGIRYQGTDPNNYVEFNNETWRIIGIVDGKVKLIRDESIGSMAWNDQDGDGSYDEGIDINNWSTATLQTYLNGDYYNSLSDKNMIDESTWHIRGYNTPDVTKYEMYGIERGTGSISGVVMYNTPSIERNVGIMYPSDYVFAAQVTSTDTTDLISYDSCQTTNWIANTQTTSFEWLITPRSDLEYAAFLACSSGYVSGSGVYYSFGVRPVLYLKSNVKITGDGDGSVRNKYQLTME